MSTAEQPLIDLTAAPSTTTYLRDLWRRREFAVAMPAQDLRAQNMDTVLGQLWHLVNPALQIGVYFVIFGIVLDTGRGVDNFFAFLIVGVVLFHLTQRVTQDATMSIVRNVGLIRSVQFPRILLPLSAVNGQTVAFLPALAIALGAVTVTGETPTLRWLALPPLLIAQYLFNLGAALIVARIGATVKDLRELIPHLFRLLFYGSGVIFSVDIMITSESWRQAFAVNPIYALITCARWCLLGTSISGEVLISTTTWCAALPILGFVFFRRAERRLGA